MLRRHRRQSAALGSCAALAVATFAGAAVALAPVPARADASDGTLTVLVNRDEDGDGSYDSGEDPPQPGIEIAVTDAAGASIRGITDDAGQFVLAGTDQLVGGTYRVVAAVPPSLSELTPVAASDTFAPFSLTVTVAAGDQTVRMGVGSTALRTRSGAVASPPVPAPAPVPPSVAPPPRFAVGDTVWLDTNRSGVQDAGERPAADISVQLLGADGEVARSTTSSAGGRFWFDNLTAGTYAVRFAGVPSGYRLSPADTGRDRGADSDPDYTGVTPPFTLGVGEPNVRPTTAADGLTAGYVNASIDAGITPLRYAIGNRVWLDANGDGQQQPDEPPAAAAVALLVGNQVVATTTADPQGNYLFANLVAGGYRVQFRPGEHRRFTAPQAASDPALDSDPDPRTGVTPVINVGSGAPDLVPASDLGIADADLVNPTVGAGLVGAYALGDTVWRDGNGNGVRDPGEPGLPQIRVQLLGEGKRVLDETVTTSSGRFGFTDLAGGPYRLRFGRPAGTALVFTGASSGGNPAVDSDAAPDGLTPPVVLGDENPDDTTIDAGLTTLAVLSDTPVTPGPGPVPADTQLSSTGGVAVSVPLAGLALVVGGLSCLLAARRRPTLR